MSYSIDNGLPIPKDEVFGNRKYPWKDMVPGDSFFVECRKNEDKNKARNRLLGATNNRRQHSEKYAVRIVTEDGVEGVRVWRVK